MNALTTEIALHIHYIYVVEILLNISLTPAQHSACDCGSVQIFIESNH